MKRKKNSKKVHKNKIFRKKAYKTYKRSRIGGVIDWSKAQTSPGTPKKKSSPSSASASAPASSRSPKKGSFKASVSSQHLIFNPNSTSKMLMIFKKALTEHIMYFL